MSGTTSQQLRAELLALETRAEQIASDQAEATERLEMARAAFVDGNATTETLSRAQSEADSLQGASELIGQRIQAKRGEVEATQSAEIREIRIEEATAHARRFFELRTHVEEDAARVVLWLESQGEGIVSRLDAASDAARDFARTVEGIENPPTFETSDGQSVRVTHIEGQGSPLALLGIYRRAFHIVPAERAFMALYEGARAEQQAGWLKGFHAQRDETALRPDPEQMAQNQAREKEFGRPFTEEEQRQNEAQRLNFEAQDARRKAEQVHIGRPRFEESPREGESVPEAIDREEQERRAENERVRRQAEARALREAAETAI